MASFSWRLIIYERWWLGEWSRGLHHQRREKRNLKWWWNFHWMMVVLLRRCFHLPLNYHAGFVEGSPRPRLLRSVLFKISKPSSATPIFVARSFFFLFIYFFKFRKLNFHFLAFLEIEDSNFTVLSFFLVN